MLEYTQAMELFCIGTCCLGLVAVLLMWSLERFIDRQFKASLEESKISLNKWEPSDGTIKVLGGTVTIDGVTHEIKV